jgi:hypothetical protein
MSLPSDDDVCQTCTRTRRWHDENKPVHPFNDGQAGAKALLGQRRGTDTPRDRTGPQGPPQYPLDPVLRQALVDAGVITPQQLRDAEEKIRVVTGLFNGQGESPVQSMNADRE